MDTPGHTTSAKRSWTGNHVLSPSRLRNGNSAGGSRTHSPHPTSQTPARHGILPTYTLLTWTFGRGSVIWRIWPAVLVHVLFASAVVTLSVRDILKLDISSMMLNVLGVVIGFVISYRAMTGYERYWLGRTLWSDIMCNARTLGRLIWYHVPLRVSPAPGASAPASSASVGEDDDDKAGITEKRKEKEDKEKEKRMKEIKKVMAEKRMALDLIHGFSVAVKHHLRGELGIYFDDLYDLIRPLHDHDHPHTADDEQLQAVLAHSTALPVPPSRKGMRITRVVGGRNGEGSGDAKAADTLDSPADTQQQTYGTFLQNPSTTNLSVHSNVSDPDSRRPLLPSTHPIEGEEGEEGVLGKVSREYVPFGTGVWRWFGFGRRRANPNIPAELEQGTASVSDPSHVPPVSTPQPTIRKWSGPIHQQNILHTKHRPKVAGDGENLPLEIVRCLSEWVSVLEGRGVVPMTSLGSMGGVLAAFENTLTGLERILTTPLPFVYSVHIRHTVWLYLFFLPFQLVSQAGYYTIPVVAIAAFTFLGFVAAGEEIEQPFGYDENDLDLDLFCHDIIGNDIKHLKQSPGLNVYLGDVESETSAHDYDYKRGRRTLDGISGTD